MPNTGFNALKTTIQVEYGKIVQLAETNGVAWQRAHICKPIFDPIADQYPQMGGYLDEADLGLGCGFPVLIAQVQPGEKVLDLGCAAGVDSFIAREAVGEKGQVTGLDITPELVERAAKIAISQGFTNVHFYCTDIEQLPFGDNELDVIISNGVFSLLTDRAQVFREMYRVLRPGGRFCVCDLVCKADIPDDIRHQILSFTGCLNGISHLHDYVDGMKLAGFELVLVSQERAIPIPFIDPKTGQDEYKGLYAVSLSGVKNPKSIAH